MVGIEICGNDAFYFSFGLIRHKYVCEGLAYGFYERGHWTARRPYFSADAEERKMFGTDCCRMISLFAGAQDKRPFTVILINKTQIQIKCSGGMQEYRMNCNIGLVKQLDQQWSKIWRNRTKNVHSRKYSMRVREGPFRHAFRFQRTTLGALRRTRQSNLQPSATPKTPETPKTPKTPKTIREPRSSASTQSSSAQSSSIQSSSMQSKLQSGDSRITIATEETVRPLSEHGGAGIGERFDEESTVLVEADRSAFSCAIC